MLSRLAKFLILSSLMAVIEILADLLERVERRDDFPKPRRFNTNALDGDTSRNGTPRALRLIAGKICGQRFVVGPKRDIRNVYSSICSL
jgi:hypothetical protein